MRSSKLDAMTAMELRGLIALREISPSRRRAARSTKRSDARGTASLNAFFAECERAFGRRRRPTADACAVKCSASLKVPFSAKDLIAVGGERSFGSRCMADNVAAADAPSVERQKAGAI